mmetsp:Transcript_119916/g.339925  ORF Transcript_119916/g.339925 Transcript_119916/m.339925 type:complete len:289 (+) Transcript_119916:615-1481(+)
MSPQCCVDVWSTFRGAGQCGTAPVAEVPVSAEAEPPAGAHVSPVPPMPTDVPSGLEEGVFSEGYLSACDELAAACSTAPTSTAPAASFTFFCWGVSTPATSVARAAADVPPARAPPESVWDVASHVPRSGSLWHGRSSRCRGTSAACAFAATTPSAGSALVRAASDSSSSWESSWRQRENSHASSACTAATALSSANLASRTPFRCPLARAVALSSAAVDSEALSASYSACSLARSFVVLARIFSTRSSFPAWPRTPASAPRLSPVTAAPAASAGASAGAGGSTMITA